MKKTKKRADAPKTFISIAKIAFGIACFLLLVYFTNFSKMLALIKQTSPEGAIGSLIIMLLTNFLFAVRNSVVLKSFHCILPTFVSFKIRLQSTFYNFTLPTSIASEASHLLKIWRFFKNKKSKTLLAFSLLYDRGLGLLSSFFLGITSFTLLHHYKARPSFPIYLTFIGLFIFTIALLPLIYSVTTKIFKISNQKYSALSQLTALTLAILTQLSNATAIYLLMHSLHFSLRFLEIIFATSIFRCLQSLPISIAGIGIGDAFNAYIFHQFGLTHTASITLALAIYCLRFFIGMIGGLWELEKLIKKKPSKIP